MRKLYLILIICVIVFNIFCYSFMSFSQEETTALFTRSIGDVSVLDVESTTALVMPNNVYVSAFAKAFKDKGITSPESITKWVGNHVKYMHDIDVWGKGDYWQTPQQTLKMHTGDCEDVAILTVSLLRALGWSSKEVFVVAGELTGGNGHAWVIVKEGTRWRTFQPTTSVIEELKGFSKEYMFLKGLALTAVDPVTGLLYMLGGQLLVDEGIQLYEEALKKEEWFAFNDEYFFTKGGLSFGFLSWSSYAPRTDEHKELETLQASFTTKDYLTLKMRITNISEYPVKTWVDIIIEYKKQWSLLNPNPWAEVFTTKSFQVQMGGNGDSRELWLDFGKPFPAGNYYLKFRTSLLTYVYAPENRPEISIFK